LFELTASEAHQTVSKCQSKEEEQRDKGDNADSDYKQ